MFTTHDLITQYMNTKWLKSKFLTVAKKEILDTNLKLKEVFNKMVTMGIFKTSVDFDKMIAHPKFGLRWKCLQLFGVRPILGVGGSVKNFKHVIFEEMASDKII